MYAELEVDDIQDIINCKNLIISTSIFLKAHIFDKSIIRETTYKKAQAKLITGFTKLNPEAVWKGEDILYLLRLVYACASSDRNELVHNVVNTAKIEKSTDFLEDFVKVFITVIFSSVFRSTKMT
jgi:hypothetical protein